MRKVMFLFFVTIFCENIFPVYHQGLLWENQNCWMISVLSALINTKSLTEKLKNNTAHFEKKDDTPEISERKRILREFLRIMKYTSKISAPLEIDEPVQISYDIYEIICKRCKISPEAMADAYVFLKHFLVDICAVYPELEEIFFIAQRDSENVYECYNENVLMHENYKENSSGENFIISAGLGNYLDLKDPFNTWPPEGGVQPYDLIKWSFVRDLLNPAERVYSEICNESKCKELNYKQIKYTAFKKNPQIMIFENVTQQGIKIPLEFQIPKKFCKKYSISSITYKLYSIIMDDASDKQHFYNYSRDINADEWWKYNYSQAEKVDFVEVENVIKGSSNQTLIPALIFYQRGE